MGVARLTTRCPASFTSTRGRRLTAQDQWVSDSRPTTTYPTYQYPLLTPQAEEGVNEVLKIQPENAKAHYRRGQVCGTPI